MTSLCDLQELLSFGQEQEMRDDANNTVDASGFEKSGVQLAWLGLEDLVNVFLPSGLGVVPAVLGMVQRFAPEILIHLRFW